MYPSEELTQLINDSSKRIFLKESAYMNDFVTYVGRVSQTLYMQLRNSIQSEPLEPLVLLRTSFLAKSLVPNYFVTVFYKLLSCYNYHIEDEIIKCMKDITVWHGNENIAFWKKTPWVKNISIVNKKGMREIDSIRGCFSFYPTKDIYQDEIEEIKKIGKKSYVFHSDDLPNGYNMGSFAHFDYKCHMVSYEFSMLHKDSYVVTAICPYGFKGEYWLHSYNISKDLEYAIDLSNGIIMPIHDFEKLMEPLVLAKTKGEDIPKMIENIYSSSWPFFEEAYNSPLKMLAFFAFDSLSEEERKEKYEGVIRSLKRMK